MKYMNKNNALIYALIAFIIITAVAVLVKNPNQNKKDDLRVVNPPVEEQQNTSQENVGASLKAKSGWQVYKGTIFDIVYPTGFTTQVSNTYEFVKFTSDSLNTNYQVYVPVTPKSLDKNFNVLESEKIETKNIGKSENCTARICSTEMIIVSGTDYKRNMVIRKNANGLVVSAVSIQYPISQESTITEDFNYFQETFVVKNSK